MSSDIVLKGSLDSLPVRWANQIGLLVFRAGLG